MLIAVVLIWLAGRLQTGAEQPSMALPETKQYTGNLNVGAEVSILDPTPVSMFGSACCVSGFVCPPQSTARLSKAVVVPFDCLGGA